MRDALSRARPVPELRRRPRHGAAGPRGPRPGRRRALRRAAARWSPTGGPRASFRWWIGWSTPAPTSPSSWTGRVRRCARCSCCSSGAEPDGLTDGLRQALARTASGSSRATCSACCACSPTTRPPSVAATIRGSIVETLLLRWTMLDRMVDLAHVLAAGPGGRTAGGTARLCLDHRTRRAPRRQRRRVARQDRAGGSRPGDAAAARRRPCGSVATADRRSSRARRDPRCLARHGGRGPGAESRFLGEALAATVARRARAPLAHGRAGGAQPAVRASGLQAQARAVEEVLAAGARSSRLRLRVAVAAGSASRRGPGAARAHRGERSRPIGFGRFGRRIPALDTAADALDLEIVD